MKKWFLFIVLVAFVNSGNYAFAQLKIDENGCVGIGTSFPEDNSKLHVQGNLAVKDTIHPYISIIPDNGFIWRIQNDQGTFRIIDSSWTTKLTIKNNGFIGIGKSPSRELDVSGEIQWNSSYLCYDQGGSIELGNSLLVPNTCKPYIDFHYGIGTAQDYNVRLQNDTTGQLHLMGTPDANFVVDGFIKANSYKASDGRIGRDTTLTVVTGVNFSTKKTTSIKLVFKNGLLVDVTP